MTKSEEVKTERYDADCTRILVGGRVNALIERLANGRWCITRRSERIGSRTYGSVRQAFQSWLTEQGDPA